MRSRGNAAVRTLLLWALLITAAHFFSRRIPIIQEKTAEAWDRSGKESASFKGSYH